LSQVEKIRRLKCNNFVWLYVF